MSWISVKERLPSPKEHVGYTFDGKYISAENYYDCEKKYWYSHVGYGENENKIEGITHWMSMPEPPKDK